MTSRSPLTALSLSLSAAILAASGMAAIAKAEPEVIAVVACDSYADLRKQLAWFGGQVGNPALVIVAESMLTGITGGRGLAGLDVKRPFGAIIAADGDTISGSGFLPVTDVDKLLDSLKGVVGPAEADGDDRKIAAPAVGGVRISSKDGWAILAPEALPNAGVTDPSELLGGLSEDFTLAVKFFPSRMPEGLRDQLAKQLEMAAARSTAQGQPVDAKALTAAVGSLAETESITIGIRLDEVKNRLLLETRSVAVAGSDSAKLNADLGEAPLTIPLAKASAKAMVRGFVAQRIPERASGQLTAWIDESVAGDSDDPISRALLGTLRAIAKAAVTSGRLDGSMTLVNAATAEEAPAFEFTGGMHVADGAALEKSLKELLGPDANLPGVVQVSLDAGRVKNANLHTVAIDLSKSDAAATLGDSLEATLAITPESCRLLVGGDAKARLADMLEGAPAAAQSSRPMAALQLSVDQWLALAARAGKDQDDPQAKALAAAAQAASEAETAVLQIQVRPIERGVAWQAAIDSGTLKAAAAAVGAASAGLPFGGPGPVGGVEP